MQLRDVLTLVAHSRAFFTIEAPALNDFSFYHYHHQRTTTRLQLLLLCVHFDQIPLDNRTTRWCSVQCVCACFFQVVWIVAPTTSEAAVASTNLRPIFQFGRFLMSRFYHRGKHKTLFTFSKGPKRLSTVSCKLWKSASARAAMIILFLFSPTKSVVVKFNDIVFF